MIPGEVRFTGLRIDPLILHESRVNQGVIPSDWTRYRFPVSNWTYKRAAEDWLHQEVEGHFTVYGTLMPDRQIILTIAFADVADAVWFRLKDGVRAIHAAVAADV